MSIRVVLADDHQVLVTALEALLNSEPDITIVGTAPDGAALLELVARTTPDVIVLDISMPGIGGLEATERLVKDGYVNKVVILSAFTERHFILEALRAGAAAYVVKHAAANELARAIRNVAAGKKYACPEVSGAIMDAVRDREELGGRSMPARLGPRERTIVRLLAEGKTSPQIAKALNIATSTVDTHRRNIFQKLNMHSVAEITRYAIREGLTLP